MHVIQTPSHIKFLELTGVKLHYREYCYLEGFCNLIIIITEIVHINLVLTLMYNNSQADVLSTKTRCCVSYTTVNQLIKIFDE